MNKYNQYGSSNLNSINQILTEGEEILWQGKPKKNAFIINSTIKMMPFAIIWFVIDLSFISMFFSDIGGFGGFGGFRGFGVGMGLFLIVFFAFHLMPVWIWLFNALSANKRWQNTEYAVTNKRILIRNGFIGYNYQNIFFTEISDVKLNIGAIDSMLKVGDILVYSNGSKAEMILDVENPQEVFNKVQKIVLDIKTDIHYPNALRPEENKGYNTQYRP